MEQKVLIVSPNCPSCEALKTLLGKKGVLEQYQILDISTPQGLDFARKMDVMAVPECVIVDGEYARMCTEKEFKDILTAKGETQNRT